MSTPGQRVSAGFSEFPFICLQELPDPRELICLGTSVQRKFVEAVFRYCSLHFTTVQIFRGSRYSASVLELLRHGPNSEVCVLVGGICLCSFRFSRAVTPAFGRLAAVEARLEGEYRRGVGRVGRESEEVA